MEPRDLLMELIKNSYSVFKAHQPGDPIRREAREDILKSVELINELDRSSTDSWVKQEQLRIEEDKNKAQAVLKEEEIKVDREGNWIDAVKGGFHAISLGWIIGKILKYEETGVVTSKAFQLATGLFKLK